MAGAGPALIHSTSRQWGLVVLSCQDAPVPGDEAGAPPVLTVGASSGPVGRGRGVGRMRPCSKRRCEGEGGRGSGAGPLATSADCSQMPPLGCAPSAGCRCRASWFSGETPLQSSMATSGIEGTGLARHPAGSLQDTDKALTWGQAEVGLLPLVGGVGGGAGPGGQCWQAVPRLGLEQTRGERGPDPRGRVLGRSCALISGARKPHALPPSHRDSPGQA